MLSKAQFFYQYSEFCLKFFGWLNYNDCSRSSPKYFFVYLSIKIIVQVENDIAEDIIELDLVASNFILCRLDILSNLENIIEDNEASRTIIRKYNTLSNLISQGQL